MIPVYQPYFPEGSLEYAHDALDSTWVSSKGPYLDKVRKELSKIWGTDYIVLTNNGTAANHLMRIALEAKYPTRKSVIAPNNVYVAAWNPFLFGRDFSIEYCDANIDTWNMDFNNATMLDHWATIILVVHNLGNIVDVPKIRQQYPNAVIIEDNCEGFGGRYRDLPAGTAADCFTMSFFGNKNVTSGEGGAFVTYDKDMYEAACQYWGQGVSVGSGRKFVHDGIGHNYRMTNIEAAILLGQLEIWQEIMLRKAIIWKRYDNAFSDMDRLVLQKKEDKTFHSRWMYGIRVLGQDKYERADKFFKSMDIETRPMFYPMTYHGHLKGQRGSIEVAEKLAREVVVLPSFPGLTEKEQEYIIRMVRKYV